MESLDLMVSYMKLVLICTLWTSEIVPLASSFSHPSTLHLNLLGVVVLTPESLLVYVRFIPSKGW